MHPPALILWEFPAGSVPLRVSRIELQSVRKISFPQKCKPRKNFKTAEEDIILFYRFEGEKQIYQVLSLYLRDTSQNPLFILITLSFITSQMAADLNFRTCGRSSSNQCSHLSCDKENTLSGNVECSVAFSGKDVKEQMSHPQISDNLISLRKPEKKPEQVKGDHESEAVRTENQPSATKSEREHLFHVACFCPLPDFKQESTSSDLFASFSILFTAVEEDERGDKAGLDVWLLHRETGKPRFWDGIKKVHFHTVRPRMRTADGRGDDASVWFRLAKENGNTDLPRKILFTGKEQLVFLGVKKSRVTPVWETELTMLHFGEANGQGSSSLPSPLQEICAGEETKLVPPPFQERAEKAAPVEHLESTKFSVADSLSPPTCRTSTDGALVTISPGQRVKRDEEDQRV
ncbi:hypothetical protein MJG53_011499 [Ovis ammon polii x Ovis aries]|uniref:Uncharacterized protein n=1 Tax=Ovis ammon polii x Ovis aries TaxID=2918886 RepID=A0ACB9UNI9_9CETA|nr:hypothetical protein MJG53_011499 [Ovis ammon polii x Ovis aries]